MSTKAPHSQGEVGPEEPEEDADVSPADTVNAAQASTIHTASGDAVPDTSDRDRRATRRGPYRKGIERRRRILDAALEVIDRDGYSGATVKQLADAVGLSQNGLLHYFGSKDELFLAVLRHRDEGLALDYSPEELANHLALHVREAAVRPERVPGLLELEAKMSMEATDPTHPAHEFFLNRRLGTLESIRSAIVVLQQRGTVRPELDAAQAALVLQAAVDGLRIQWFYSHTLDLDAGIRLTLDALGIPIDDLPDGPTANADR
ncbi:TetR/AcrR family transcriptional regulator [Actinomyces ruminis]|uniref:TetR/AcrR family transcriptional regulator n=1 Tax=Actinomyces ruminis TaxID=1937003 RepID=UPI0015D50CE2|nr:TetR/AcrR family transcriptional regulator [Actinomyces ruminis]